MRPLWLLDLLLGLLFGLVVVSCLLWLLAATL